MVGDLNVGDTKVKGSDADFLSYMHNKTFRTELKRRCVFPGKMSLHVY
jgi:hypothetical protein